MGATEIAVIIVVIGLRLLLPLTIPYVPIVGLVSCLVLDAVDQTIFQQFPAIPLDGYQSYDKALDIYYLTITYLSTFRNWTNQPAFRVNQFLFYSDSSAWPPSNSRRSARSSSSSPTPSSTSSSSTSSCACAGIPRA